VALNTIDWLSG